MTASFPRPSSTPLSAAAIARWEAAGITPAQDALLRHVTFSVKDLPGLYLGEAAAGKVTLDSNAAGNSWFIDPTPGDDSEFSGAGTEMTATATGGAAGRVDALTTVLHELGHQLGLDDIYTGSASDNLMYGYIHQSERRLPAAHQGDGATPHLAAGELDFGVLNPFPISIGTLNAGQNVQVVFTAQINPNDTATTITNQGTGSSTQTASVQSDGDPATAGQQPTVTQVAFPAVNLAIGATTSVAEDSGGNLVYTFTREGPLTNPLTVNFNVSGVAAFTGNAAADTDYTQSGAASFSATAGTVTFLANSPTATVTITPHADTLTESDESVILTLASGNAYSVATTGSVSGTGTIINDDTTVSVSGAPGSVAEDSGTGLVYTFKRIGVLTNSLAVNFSVAGTATFTSDYSQGGATSFTATDGVVTFAPGQDTATVTLTPVADNTVEADETAVLTVASGAGYNVDSQFNNLTGTITNDDATVSVAVSPASVVEDGSGNLVYTFTRSGFLGAKTLSFSVGGTATFNTDYTQSGASTFTSTTGTVDFLANATQASVTIDPTPDSTVEPDETVTLTATTGGGFTAAAAPDDAATGTIQDDDTSLHAALDGSGNLTIADTNATGKNNDLTFKLINNGTQLEITDAAEVFDGVPSTAPASTLSNGGRTLTVPFSAVTGSLTINTAGGSDTVTLDLSGGDFINAAGVFYNGGDPTVAPGDKLVISGGSQGTVTYNSTNAHDGSVAMSNFGTVNYTGLEPVINSGTATDVIFNLPDSADTVFLEDNGSTASDGLLRLRSSTATFEQTDFAIPTGSLTINLGAGNDTLTVSATPQFTAGLTINGGAGDDTVNLNGAITFGADKNLNVDLQDDAASPGVDVINVGAGANYVLSGAGAATLKASKNIVVNGTGRIATQNGALTVEANQQATATAGSFTGVTVSGTLESTGTGIVSVLGKGGDNSAGNQVGVRLVAGGLIRGGSTGNSTVVTGTGGISLGTANSGVQVAGGTIQSVGGNIVITGVGGGTGVASSGNGGIGILSAGQVLGGTNGNVTLDGTRGVGTGNAIALAATGATVSSLGTGNITIIGDTLRIDTSGTTINAGTNQVTLRQKTNATPIDVGSPSGPTNNLVELSNPELSRITAGTVQVGDSNSGAISITAVISPVNYNTLSFGNAASFTSTGGFISDVTSGTVYEKILVAGALTIDSAATLTVNSATYVPTASDAFTIINNTSAGTTTGAFAGKPESTTVPVGGVNERITYMGGAGANDVVLQSTSVSVALGAATSVSEGSAGTLVYTFTRSGDTTDPVTINFSAGGTADFANDYSLSGADSFNTATGLGTITIAAASSTAQVTLTPTNDKLVEGDETAILSVNSGTGYGVGTSPAIGTINDNETATVSFAAPSSNAAEGTSPHTVGVKLTTFSPEGTASLANDLTIDVADAGTGTATGGGVDYTFNGQQVTFLAGDTGSTKDVSLAIVDDSISEGDETVQLGLTTPSAGALTVDSTKHTVTIADNDVDMHVKVAGPGAAVTAGSGADNLVFTVTVNNSGLTAATNVKLDELFTLPSGVTFSKSTATAGTFSGSTWTIPSLAPGADETLTLKFTADHSTANNAAVTVQSTATSADQTLVNTGDDSDSQQSSVTRASDISVSLSDSPDPVGPGATLTYTIVVSNAGPSDASGVGVTDNFPTDLSNISWSSTASTSGTGDISDTIDVPAGGSVTYTVTGTVSTAASNTTISNTATVSSAQDTNPSNDSKKEDTFVGGVDLKIDNSNGVTSVTPGQLVVYTLTYRNGGFVTANGVKITDAVPTDAVFDFAHSTAGWTGVIDGSAAGTVGTFDIGSLAVSSTGQTIKFAVRLLKSVPAGHGTFDNTATIADDGANGTDVSLSDNTGKDSDTLTAAPDLVLTKSDGGINSRPGGTVPYTLSYSNAGHQDATGVVISETLPANTMFNPSASSVGWVHIVSDLYQFTVGNLAAGGKGSTVFAVTVNDPAPSGVQSISNKATIADDASNGADPTPDNNTGTDTTPIVPPITGLSGRTLPENQNVSFTEIVADFKAPVGSNANQFTASIDWRDGTTTVGTVVQSGVAGQFWVKGTHTYKGNGQFITRITVAAKGGGPTSAVTGVVNVAAELTPISRTINLTHNVSFGGVVGSFTDHDSNNRDASVYHAVVDWGDGTVTPLTVGQLYFNKGYNRWDVTGGHKYTTAGRRTIKISIQRKDGPSTLINSTAVVS